MRFKKWRPAKRAGRPRVAKARGYRSGLEERYADFLAARKAYGEVRSWKYESHKLALGGGAWFTPDFVVVTLTGMVEIHECKGYWRDAAKLRMKIAAEKYDEFAWYVVYDHNGVGFDIQRWEAV